MGDPRISLIVEWDNARYREIERARRMLRRVVEQIGDLAEPVEVLVVYDELEVADVLVKGVVEEIRRAAPAGVEMSTISSPGSRYYQLKNAGARRARGALFVFVDSDVLPEASWLSSLVGPFDDPKVHIVMANTYVDTDTLYGKIFALCWYFPLRSPDGPLTPTASSFVNSLAMRRSTFQRYPFPEDRELYIGQCLGHIETLQANGVGVYLNPRARVAHPPPTFLRSAIINGHDAVIRASRGGDRLQGKARASYWRWRGNLGPACRRILARYREVDLPWTALPIALLTAAAYYSLLCVAELLTRANPRLVRRLYAL
jgi:Glycosyl transferase family 2